MAGTISMHSRLDIAELADALEVSTTPVREAAMRLWGAGLLEPHPKGGLCAVLATEARLRALLDLNERLIGAALSVASNSDPDRRVEIEPSLEARSRAIFRRIAERTGNVAFSEVVDGLSDRLAVFRNYEAEFLPDVTSELDALACACDRIQLRKAVRRYHRRRMAHALELVWAASAGSADGR